MKNLKWWPALGLATLGAAALTACGSGSSSSDTSVRVLNATLTHSSIDVLVNASAGVTAVTTDTVSAYVGPPSGSVVLQVNDAGQSTALATLSPTIGSGAHDTLVVYEGASGAIRTTLLPEDTALPASGASGMNVLDAAIDAGALDVYVTAVGADLSTATPIFSLSAQTFVQFPGVSTLTPGTYQVRVTGQGNKADLRANIPSVTLASQQLGLLVLTPATGGILLNAGVLLEQVASTYTAQRNTNARVRLASGVVGPSTTAVTATAGAISINPGATNTPAISAYSTVPAAGSSTSGVLGVTVNGVAQTVPVSTLAAGSDNTLLVTGVPGATTVQVVADDNHLPTSSTYVKVRLVNGLSGPNAENLTLSFNSSFLPSVLPGAASTAYSSLFLPTTTTSEIDATSASGIQPYAKSNLTLTPNSVYTLFVLGDLRSITSPVLSQLRQDR